jgi:hypothetical protein
VRELRSEKDGMHKRRKIDIELCWEDRDVFPVRVIIIGEQNFNAKMTIKRERKVYFNLFYFLPTQSYDL